MFDPLQVIEEAKAEVEKRRKARHSGHNADDRGSIALESIADDMTIMRAELTVLRLLMATNAAMKR